MTDYLPTTNEVRGSLVFLNKHYAEQRADVDVDLLVVESETAAQFDRMIAEVRRQAAEEALLKAAASFEATDHAWGKLAMIEHLRARTAEIRGWESK